MPLVSVIVPVFNDEEFLAECLASIERQSLEDIEVICIDDGSTDSSLSICKEFARQDARFKVIALPQNQGVSHARNCGMDAATGDYLAFMDADDWYPEATSLQKLYDAAASHGMLVSGGSLQRYNQALESIIEVSEDERELLDGFVFDAPGVVSFADWQNDYGFYRFLYKRSLLESTGIRFPALVRHEDPVFLVQALLSAGEFYAIPDAVYTLRMGYKSVQLGPKAIDDALEGVFQILALCEKNGLDKLRQRQKAVLKRYFVDSQDMLQEFYLKDLLQESAQRIGRKALGVLHLGKKGGTR